MREERLQGRQKRAYKPRTTQSNHDGPIAPNHAPKPTACDQLWRTDITYIRTAEGWLYLAVIIDAYSRRILGWAFSESLEASLVPQAMHMAILRRAGRLPKGLVIHSDRGVQYASRSFRAYLNAYGLSASMSRRGNCHDNAQVESFFSTIKLEFIYGTSFATREQARHACFEWIEAFYNRRRRHSSIGYLCPADFENQNN